jgi:prevent-host-death family protein
MDTKTTLPISEARKRIFEIADEVQKPGLHYTFTVKGRPKIVMMSAEEFESLQETIEVLRDFPDLDKDINEMEKDLKSGKHKSYKTLEELTSEYEISGNIQTKHRKRSGKNSR